MMIFELIGIFCNIVGVIGIFLLYYNSIRSRFFTCYYNSGKIDIPKDEQKETYRKTALAELSRLKGGKRIEYKNLRWRGNKLEIDNFPSPCDKEIK